MATAQDIAFGEALKRYRLAANLTQEELAEQSQMSVRGLVYLERGERHPHRDTVQRLADALSLPESERAAFEAMARRLARRDDDNQEAGVAADGARGAGATSTAQVYVSYAHADRAIIERLIGDLEERGVAIWSDDLGLLPGTPSWEKALRDAIHTAPAVLVAASPRMRAARYVADELRVAELYRRTILPVWLEGDQWMEGIPLGWGGSRYIDARHGGYEAALQEIVGAVQRTLSQSNPVSDPILPTPAPLFMPRNPYKGLRAFQVEELFTLTVDDTERRQFIDLLVTAITEPRGPLVVILTLRADFYDRPMSYPQLGHLVDVQGASVLPLELHDLRAAIEGPAELPDVRLSFEGDLVGDLLYEVRGQAGALPLLQFTLDGLFARRDGQRLTQAAYRELGGVRGALGRHAEGAYTALPSPEHRGLARALFLRLIEPGVTVQDTTRRRAPLAELDLPDLARTALLREAAQAFVVARLLTTSESGGATTIEVSHEALIREWARLAGWLHEAREDIRLQRSIGADAAEWARHDEAPDYLYRGAMLHEAEDWAARNTPSAIETAFLHAIAREAAADPALVKGAPHETLVGRIDETRGPPARPALAGAPQHIVWST